MTEAYQEAASSSTVLSSKSRRELYSEILTCNENDLRAILRYRSEQNESFAQTLHTLLCVNRSRLKKVSNPLAIEEIVNAEPESNRNPDPDSDKENSDVTPTNATLEKDESKSRKRKAVDIDSVTSSTKKARGALTATNEELHFKDQYQHCINCYELFDVMGTPCHEHDWDASGSEVADHDDHNDETPTDRVHDCYYHSGYMEPDEEAFEEHDEEMEGDIDSDWTRNEYPENYTWDCCDKRGDTRGCKGGRHKPGSVLSFAGRLKKAAAH